MLMLEVQMLAEDWFGSRWREGLCTWLEIDPVTLWRWEKAGVVPAPYPILFEGWSRLGGPEIELPPKKPVGRPRAPVKPKKAPRKYKRKTGPKVRKKHLSYVKSASNVQLSSKPAKEWTAEKDLKL